MTTQPALVTDADVAVARRYAETYAAFDTDILRSVLDPDLRFRRVNPGGFLTLDSSEAYISATADFLAGFNLHAASSARVEPIGDRIATASRMVLHAGAQRFVMEHEEFVTVHDQRVVAFDSV
jgi:hypothetical protein